MSADEARFIPQQHWPARTKRAWHDALGLHCVHDGFAVGAGLVQGLLEQDAAGDVLAQAGGGDQQLAVRQAVGLGVLQADRVQALAAGGVGLVHGQDAVALRRHRFLRPRCAPSATAAAGDAPAPASRRQNPGIRARACARPGPRPPHARRQRSRPPRLAMATHDGGPTHRGLHELLVVGAGADGEGRPGGGRPGRPDLGPDADEGGGGGHEGGHGGGGGGAGGGSRGGRGGRGGGGESGGGRERECAAGGASRSPDKAAPPPPPPGGPQGLYLG